jgi:hypothetical protein
MKGMKTKISTRGIVMSFKAEGIEKAEVNGDVSFESKGYDVDVELELKELQEINRNEETINTAVGKGLKYLLEQAPTFITEIGDAILSIEAKQDTQRLARDKARILQERELTPALKE